MSSWDHRKDMLSAKSDIWVRVLGQSHLLSVSLTQTQDIYLGLSVFHVTKL